MKLTRVVSIFLFALVVVFVTSSIGVAQSAIEQAAVQQIARETGIDSDDLASLFVTDGPDQYIIAFIFITEATLESDLRQDLKDAVTPFVDRNALLTLVVPTRQSNFNPTELAFVQNNVVHLLPINQIHPITDNFFAGQLPANAVSSGIIEIPKTLDFESQFEIVFRGEFRVPFSVAGEAVVEEEEQQSSGGGGIFGNALLSFITFLISILLIPFLILL